MWAHPLTIALMAALVAAASSLLTIFLTPRLQHHFWKYQRRDELRLEAINDFNRLSNELLARHLYGRPMQDRAEQGEAWFASLNTASARVEVLFSEQAVLAIKAVDKMINPGVRLQGEAAEEFVKLRDTALGVLYREVIPLPRGLKAK
jgi:hypothetical protein